jgi:meiotically up-regulated gene 157 (Mug157) protein
MPTILLLLGWRLFFYANEGNEPIHVHCKKGDMECKYWLDTATFDVSLAYAFKMSPRATREIRKIVFQHFDYIVDQWEEFQERRKS